MIDIVIVSVFIVIQLSWEDATELTQRFSADTSSQSTLDVVTSGDLSFLDNSFVKMVYKQ